MTEQNPGSGAALSDGDRRMAEAVRLYYRTGLSLRQVAARQSVSHQTVANDLARWIRERSAMPAAIAELIGDLPAARRPAGPRPGIVPNGPMLRHLRETRGLTAAKLAKRIGRDISTVYKAEANTITISEVLAGQLAGALGVPVEEILADIRGARSGPETPAVLSA